MLSGTGEVCDDNFGGPDWKGTGWYRFTGAAGTRMPTTSPGPNHCGTWVPGWVNGTYPTALRELKKVQICFDWNDNLCEYTREATIRNCGAYFLFNLVDITTCPLRYCGSFS